MSSHTILSRGGHEQGNGATVFELPADDSAVIGADTIITTHHEDTLLDSARKYGLGYDEIIRANPGVDMWLPGEGTYLWLPGRCILPPGPHKGVVVSLPEHASASSTPFRRRSAR